MIGITHAFACHAPICDAASSASAKKTAKAVAAENLQENALATLDIVLVEIASNSEWLDVCTSVVATGLGNLAQL